MPLDFFGRIRYDTISPENRRRWAWAISRISSASARQIWISTARRARRSICGIEAALRAFGAARQQTLYVGDSVVDAGAAQQAAVPFAAVLTGATPAAAFDAYPHVAICQNLRGLLTL